ncbi:unnamed protein product [Heligmosomoides polygyrus]|uniref:Secreted protein n=1 Tax=Heligmosomoides polygyrus TaxID=6339 RepID=A0A183FXT1_HELPZ|nr:unnamed protein product [Heligmosomoides polygyrus]
MQRLASSRFLSLFAAENKARWLGALLLLCSHTAMPSSADVCIRLANNNADDDDDDDLSASTLVIKVVAGKFSTTRTTYAQGKRGIWRRDRDARDGPADDVVLGVDFVCLAI